MPPAPHEQSSDSELKADYTSSHSSRSFTYPLPSASDSANSTTEKTAYLSALRKSVVQLQEDINALLTTKMDEDKALAASAGMKADDKKEEENYGEEGVEEEG